VTAVSRRLWVAIALIVFLVILAATVSGHFGPWFRVGVHSILSKVGATPSP
jgi:hypothetical protein